MLSGFPGHRFHAEVDLRMRRYRGELRGMEWRSLLILLSLSLGRLARAIRGVWG